MRIQGMGALRFALAFALLLFSVSLGRQAQASTTTNYQYDARGRLSSVGYSTTSNVTTLTFSYDTAGNRTLADKVVAANQTVSTPTGVPATVNALTGSTALGGALTVTALGTAANGSASINTGATTVTYTPNAGFTGSDSFTYALTDGQHATSTATVTVNVGGAQGPVANNDSATTSVSTPVTVSVLANDTSPQGYALSVTGAGSGAHGATAVNGGTTVTYTPANGYSGSDAFSYSISDGHGGTASAMVSVTINAGSGPVANNDSATTPAGAPVIVHVLANDTSPQGYSLTVTGVGAASHGVPVVSGGGTTVTYTPSSGYTGADSFTYSISDGHGGSASAAVSVTVNALPIANNDSATTAVNTPVTVSVLANDSSPEGYALSVTSATNGSHGTSVVNNGTTITYTPTSGYTGSDSFTYTISDGHGGTATATVSVTVSAAGQPPVANSDTLFAQAYYSGGAGVVPQGSIDPRANDSSPEGYPLTIIAVTQGAKGSVTFSGTTVTYTFGTAKRTNFTTTDSFTYTISDGHGGTASATVSVSVEVDTNQ